MGITLRVVSLIDKLHLQNYFVEREDRVFFAPIRISLNERILEQKLDHLFKLKGKAYKMNQFEKNCLKELDF